MKQLETWDNCLQFFFFFFLSETKWFGSRQQGGRVDPDTDLGKRCRNDVEEESWTRWTVLHRSKVQRHEVKYPRRVQTGSRRRRSRRKYVFRSPFPYDRRPRLRWYGNRPNDRTSSKCQASTYKSSRMPRSVSSVCEFFPQVAPVV